MSLADSFLADLEDIEDTSIVAAPIKSESAESTIQEIPNFPSLLQDSSFQPFINQLRSSNSGDFVLIEQANSIFPLIDAEISTIQKFVAGIYSNYFPELEQIVVMPLEYLRAVDCIGNNIEKISPEIFSNFLPNNLIVALTVTASTITGRHLSGYNFAVIQYRLQTAFTLADFKNEILNFLQSRMPIFAPNLSALLGPLLAAQLVSAAGGLESLATMPSQNIESVGAHKRTSAGMSTASISGKISLISKCDIVENCPEETRKRALRLVVGKTSICARVDQFSSSPLGQVGSKFREEILDSIRNLNEPPPARAIKPLPIPQDLLPKKTRRGGARARRFKEKYALTETQKQANRIQFSATNSSGGNYLDGIEDGVDRGMIGLEAGGGRIRKQAVKKQKLQRGGNHKKSTPPGTKESMELLAIPLSLAEPTITGASNGSIFSSSLGFTGGR